jgi:hypothetical protein
MLSSIWNYNGKKIYFVGSPTKNRKIGDGDRCTLHHMRKIRMVYSNFFQTKKFKTFCVQSTYWVLMENIFYFLLRGAKSQEKKINKLLSILFFHKKTYNCKLLISCGTLQSLSGASKNTFTKVCWWVFLDMLWKQSKHIKLTGLHKHTADSWLASWSACMCCHNSLHTMRIRVTFFHCTCCAYG